MSHVSVSSKLEVMYNERDRLREEIIQATKHIRLIVLVILLVASITALVYLAWWYWEVLDRNVKVLIQDKHPLLEMIAGVLPYVIFGFSQVEIFLGVFALGIWANQRIHSGYLAVLEEKMNALFEDPVSIWESEIAYSFMYRIKGPFPWGLLFLMAFLAAILFLMIGVVFKIFGSIAGAAIAGAAVTLEVIAIIVLTGFIIFERDRVIALARRKFNMSDSN